ncbi:MAG: hypothetical protein MGF17_06770 [Trichodesmium sp. MAG_R04]|nr:hypothetical protein [Trichodesmium sp. MAG_R04]
MNLTILPLRVIISQSLILLVIIAIESYFFQLRLNLTPKVSVEYATVINLISTCIGWVLFFYGVSLLPSMWEKQMVAYILFGKIGAIYPGFMLFIFLFFLISLIIKLVGFNFCDSLWNEKSKNPAAGTKIYQVFRELRTPKFMVILVAHTCSNLAIGLILFLQRSQLT